MLALIGHISSNSTTLVAFTVFRSDRKEGSMENEPKKPAIPSRDSAEPVRDQTETESGVTRRGFLASFGAGVAVAAAGVPLPAEAAVEATKPGEMIRIVLQINGQPQRLLIEPRWSLLHVIREVLGLTSTKVGCERGECGACTVLIDGRTQYACMMLAVESEGLAITTLEGLMDGEKLGQTQQAFAAEDAFQCGYCTPGQVMSVEGLLRKNPHPTPEEIRQGVSGNLCRCGAYHNIFKAAEKAAKLKAGRGGAS
jgi:xanthine dehydrogenase YagT iron-sulfur-binding subunit